MKVTVIETLKANDELVEAMLRDGATEVVVIDDFDEPEETGGSIRRWCHVIPNAEREQHVREHLFGAKQVKPTPEGLARFYINTPAESVTRLLSFHINARVYVDRLVEGEEPDISLESKVRDALDRRKAHTAGVLRTWVAGQVGRAIWVQEDGRSGLIPYFLSELDLVSPCICKSMSEREGVEYPQGWQCPYHGFVRKSTEHLGVYAEQERAGRLIQTTAV